MPANDAIAVLKKDHQAVRELFAQVDELSDRASSARRQLFDKIARELELHTQVENEIFYPAFREAAEDRDDVAEVLEAHEEHDVVADVIGKLRETDPKDETYQAKLTVLKELVEHHVREEEKEMFPRAKELFEPDELRELGAQILEMKEQATARPARGRARQPAARGR